MRRSSLKRIGKPVRMEVVVAPKPPVRRAIGFTSGLSLGTLAEHATLAAADMPTTTCPTCHTIKLLHAQGVLTLSMGKYIPTLHSPAAIVLVTAGGVLTIVEPHAS